MSFLGKLFGPRAEDSIRQGITPAPSSEFRCVQVNANGDDCCQAALELSGMRFLPEEIPRLPLAGCEADSCNCSYELFSDRRRVPRPGTPQEDEQARPVLP